MKVRNCYLISIIILIALCNLITSFTLNTDTEVFSTYDMCFTNGRATTKFERTNLKQFANKGIITLLQFSR